MSSNLPERIEHGGELLALILRSDLPIEGTHFYTPPEFSQQLGSIRIDAGYVIEPHTHNEVPREVVRTQEVLLIRSGSLRVDFYTAEKAYLESRVLNAGDVILLVAGGHGFEALSEVRLLEVKQGPYLGEQDKVRFAPVASEQLCIPDAKP